MLVQAERGRCELGALIADADEAAIAAVTAAELLLGVELAAPGRRQRRQAYVDALLATLPVEDYDLDVARVHAALLAFTRRSGRPRGAHDLIVAATASARDRVVVTSDASGFEGLPGVEVRACLSRGSRPSGRRQASTDDSRGQCDTRALTPVALRADVETIPLGAPRRGTRGASIRPL